VVNYPQFLTSQINDEIAKQELTIFPNPANNILNIKSSWLNQNAVGTVSIYSVIGNVVKTEKLSNEIDVSELSQGVYFVEVITEEHHVKIKFLKN
jgi:hypothetical protein